MKLTKQAAIAALIALSPSLYAQDCRTIPTRECSKKGLKKDASLGLSIFSSEKKIDDQNTDKEFNAALVGSLRLRSNALETGNYSISADADSVYPAFRDLRFSAAKLELDLESDFFLTTRQDIIGGQISATPLKFVNIEHAQQLSKDDDSVSLHAGLNLIGVGLEAKRDLLTTNYIGTNISMLNLNVDFKFKDQIYACFKLRPVNFVNAVGTQDALLAGQDTRIGMNNAFSSSYLVCAEARFEQANLLVGVSSYGESSHIGSDYQSNKGKFSVYVMHDSAEGFVKIPGVDIRNLKLDLSTFGQSLSHKNKNNSPDDAVRYDRRADGVELKVLFDF